ncbi:hypothetical protein GCM10017559_45110 [Streptosporangium longisporum]|uniref:Uncharacterized protein n=1 Tax=Streptosporangium longisporum TaxID=46187 RepID=A0ABN3Y4A7_9ACTN
MVSDKRNKDIADGDAVARGVDGDAPKRVNSTKSYIDGRRAELFNGFGVPVSDLSFLGRSEGLRGIAESISGEYDAQ